MISIDMPAGPSEVLVIADQRSNPAYVASDLLSQAEHGTDSQVVLVAVGFTAVELAAVEDQIHEQASRLPRVDIVRQSISKSFVLSVDTFEEAIQFSNDYAPEHLILHVENAETLIDKIENAGSVFVGEYSPERSVFSVFFQPDFSFQINLILLSSSSFTAVAITPQAQTTHFQRTVTHACIRA